MNIRILSAAAAVVIALGAPVSAFAQSYNAPAGIPAAVAPGGSRIVGFHDDITTGSLDRRADRSAKEGNAEQNDKVVPNYGTTSGGPAY